MKALLSTLSLLLLLGACSPASQVARSVVDPEQRPEVKVDRFSDASATWFKRSAPLYDPENIRKLLPAASGGALDLDKNFLVESLGPAGERISFYMLDAASETPGRGWVFRYLSGGPVPKQLPIIDKVPGEPGYSDFVRVTELTVPDEYVSNTLLAAEDVEAAVKAGWVQARDTKTLANWAVVPSGTVATRRFNGAPVAGFRAWYKKQVASFLRFDGELAPASDKVPAMLGVFRFAAGQDPAKGFRYEAGSRRSRNVVEHLPGEGGYSSLLRAVAGKPEDFDSVKDLASSKASEGADLKLLFNCPVVSP